MKYQLKAGILCQLTDKETLTPIASIKNKLCGAEKKIQVEQSVYSTQIVSIESSQPKPKGSCPHQYVLLDEQQKIILQATPYYAEGEDPSISGWPLYRMPQVELAKLTIDGQTCLLQMLNVQNYRLTTNDQTVLAEVIHRGISGGWNINTYAKFSPEILCGLSIFCRYLEQESELMAV